jgi:hypothetical protein
LLNKWTNTFNFLRLHSTVSSANLKKNNWSIDVANYSVVPNPDGTWDARQDGASRASSIHETQAEAFEAAKNYTINSGGGDVCIHGLNNKIREKNTYGKKDNYPPSG